MALTGNSFQCSNRPLLFQEVFISGIHFAQCTNITYKICCYKGSGPTYYGCNSDQGSTSCAGPTSTPTPTPGCPLAKQGDINCSGKINALDLSILLGKFGTADPLSDLNSSGKVNALDLSILLSNFGRSG